MSKDIFFSNLTKRFILFIFIIFFVFSLIIPVFYFIFGVKKILEIKYSQVFSSFQRYVLSSKETWLFISSDNILRSSFLQLSLAQNVKELQSHLNRLVANFDSVQSCAIYDRNGKLFLATDYKSMPFSLNASLLFAREPVCDVFFSSEYNSVVMAITGPLKNSFSFQTGFVRIIFLLKPFINAAGLNNDFRLFILQSGRVYPLIHIYESFDEKEILKPSSKKNFSKILYSGKSYIRYDLFKSESGMTPVLMINAYPLSLYIIVGINLLFIVFLIFASFFLIKRYNESRKIELFKKSAEEISAFSKKTVEDVNALKDIVQQIQTEKVILLEKLGSEQSTEDKREEFKLIEPL